jgi:pimeloyl-ACP methyl ester carboxylesterase
MGTSVDTDTDTAMTGNATAAEKLLDPALFEGAAAGDLRAVRPQEAGPQGAAVEDGTMTVGLRTFRQGSGPVPLVLLHAFPVDGRMWATSMRSLEQLTEKMGGALASMPILGFDVPGVPGVPVPPEDESGPADADGGYREAFDRLADTFVALLRSLGYEKAVWAGLSMGGYLALDIVRRHPQTVAGFALCDSNPYADNAAHRANRLAMADRAAGADGPGAVMHFARPGEGDSALKRSDAYIALFTQWIRSQPGQGLAWRERMAAGRADTSQALEILDSSAVPALFVCGQRDHSSGPDVMRPLAERVPGSLFVEIPDAGHFTAVERPDQFAAALLPLLACVYGRVDEEEA